GAARRRRADAERPALGGRPSGAGRRTARARRDRRVRTGARGARPPGVREAGRVPPARRRPHHRRRRHRPRARRARVDQARARAALRVRVHIFQRAERGIARTREYGARGELPLAVLTPATPPDPGSGARDWSEIAARLRAQVPTLPLVLLGEPGVAISPANE